MFKTIDNNTADCISWMQKDRKWKAFAIEFYIFESNLWHRFDILSHFRHFDYAYFTRKKKKTEESKVEWKKEKKVKRPNQEKVIVPTINQNGGLFSINAELVKMILVSQANWTRFKKTLFLLALMTIFFFADFSGILILITVRRVKSIR